MEESNNETRRSLSVENVNRGRYLENGKLNISGRWNSPGPGKYLLPSCVGHVKHDFTQTKTPAYSFGSKLPKTSYTDSPGPIYRLRPDVYVTGKSNKSGFAISGRHKEIPTSIGPGPQQYSPEKHIQNFQKGYTFGSRYDNLRASDYPVGPNKYKLPSTIGTNNVSSKIVNAPSFSLSTRNKFNSPNNSTEECKSFYFPRMKFLQENSPKWTMTGRNYPTTNNSSDIPGPNKYKTERVKIAYHSAPKCYLGIKHSEFSAIPNLPRLYKSIH